MFFCRVAYKKHRFATNPTWVEHAVSELAELLAFGLSVCVIGARDSMRTVRPYGLYGWRATDWLYIWLWLHFSFAE